MKLLPEHHEIKRSIHGRLQLSHLVGIGALAVLMPSAHLLSPLALAAVTAAILLVVAAWEAWSLGSGPPVQSDATTA